MKIFMIAFLSMFLSTSVVYAKKKRKRKSKKWFLQLKALGGFSMISETPPKEEGAEEAAASKDFIGFHGGAAASFHYKLHRKIYGLVGAGFNYVISDHSTKEETQQIDINITAMQVPLYAGIGYGRKYYVNLVGGYTLSLATEYTSKTTTLDGQEVSVNSENPPTNVGPTGAFGGLHLGYKIGRSMAIELMAEYMLGTLTSTQINGEETTEIVSDTPQIGAALAFAYRI